MVLDKIAAILFKTEHHWKTKQRASIGIPNKFSIPAPILVYSLSSERLYTVPFCWQPLLQLHKHGGRALRWPCLDTSSSWWGRTTTEAHRTDSQQRERYRRKCRSSEVERKGIYQNKTSNKQLVCPHFASLIWESVTYIDRVRLKALIKTSSK